MDKNKAVWNIQTMYCPNCGTLNNGHTDACGRLKYECKNPRCRTVVIRTPKSRRHDTIDIYKVKVG